MKKFLEMQKSISIFIILFIFSTLVNANSIVKKKKVLYVNSYHKGLYWSDGIEKAIKNTLLKSGIPINFKRIEMDTKRNSSEEYKLRIAKKVKDLIESFNPDVVITSDDNAA